MKVLLDTNVVLDTLLKREEFYRDSVKIFALVEYKKITGYLCANSLTTIFYLLRKKYDNASCMQVIDNILKLFSIANVDKSVLLQSLQNCGIDYEDSVIYTSASKAKVDFVITRDKRGFENSPVKILSPKEFLDILQ